MATLAQVEEGHFNHGLLPPLRELFLEIQINKLIQEYLFSSNADKMCTPLHDESSEHNQKTAADRFCGSDTAPWVSAYSAAPAVIKSAADQALDDNQKQIPHDPHRKPGSQALLTLHSITCIEDHGLHGNKDQMLPCNAMQTANSLPEASLATLTVESGVKEMHKSAHLNRDVGSFPCTSDVQSQLGMANKAAKMELKTSCKKPPRPPKVPKSVSLTRCSSDNGPYLQSLRRDRKRKATATSTVSASISALLFTLCFGIIVIAQGFWSQDSQIYRASGSGLSSSIQTFMKESTTKRPPEGPSAGGVPVEREASMEGALAAGREASREGVLAQSHVTRKVKQQHLSDMEPLELDTFTTS